MNTLRARGLVLFIGSVLVAAILCSTLVSVATFLDSSHSSGQKFSKDQQPELTTAASRLYGITSPFLFESFFEEEIDDELQNRLALFFAVIYSEVFFDAYTVESAAVSVSDQDTGNSWGEPLYIAFHSLKIPAHI